MQRPLRLLDNHLVAAADEDGDGPRVLALLNDEHVVLGRAERQLPDSASAAELLGSQLTESGHNAAAGSDGDQFDLGTSDPTNGGQFPL